MSKTLKVSGPAAHEHGLAQNRGHIIGHRIVVQGFYLSSKIDPHNGHFEKNRVAYREEFRLPAGAHKVHGQGALGHILSDSFLADRLSEKDKNFRAIATHVVSEHENIYEMTIEEVAAKEAEEKAKADAAKEAEEKAKADAAKEAEEKAKADAAKEAEGQHSGGQ